MCEYHRFGVTDKRNIIAILLCSTYVLADGYIPAQHEQLIIDTDPGIDDVVAILTALTDPRATVLGITVVRGNTDLHNGLVNTLTTLIVAGKPGVPVYAGAEGGLVETPVSDDYFGEDGLRGGSLLMKPSLDQVRKKHAAVYLAEIVEQSPGNITVICLGPLTNIALAIHLNPYFLQQVKRLVFLGGSVRGEGNRVPGVEFNMFTDPDAAAFVLDKALAAGVLITQIPMETVEQTDLTKDWRWNKVAKIKNQVVKFLNKIEYEQAKYRPEANYHPYDVFAMATVLEARTVLKVESLYGAIETRGTRSRGALMVDYSNLTMKAPNLRIVTCVNVTTIKQLMYTNLAKYT